MAGALMQLAAYGVQDVYLTAEPTITYWKAVYRRYTNFSMESISQSLSGIINFGNKFVCRISRNGDLIGRTYLQVTLPDISSYDNYYVNRIGFNLIKSVELKIGGQQIDKHYSNWMYVWTELTHNVDMKELLDKLVGIKNGTINTQSNPGSLNIPLLFSYCRNPGLALPLIALQYHEVELWFELETINNCIYYKNITVPSNLSLSNVKIWIDYIFLDTEERKEFAQKPHEYLIEITQSQDNSISSINKSTTRLTFNHPTKFISWIIKDSITENVCINDFIQIDAGGRHVIALKTDGTLWSWGGNDYGQLGKGQVDIYPIFYSVPLQVGTDNDWASVYAGFDCSFAIKNNGLLYATGNNVDGQLGLADNINKSVFTQVGTAQWKMVASSYGHTLGIRTNNTLWSTGRNTYGELGQNNTTDLNIFTQVGTDNDWKYVNTNSDPDGNVGVSLAIKNNNTLWAAGADYEGQCGLGAIDVSIPVFTEVGGTWKTVSTGQYHSIGIKLDNTLWGWGSDGNKQLNGIGTFYIPTEIDNDTDWDIIDSHGKYNIAIKTDNTIWGWGLNSSGQLNLNNPTNLNMFQLNINNNYINVIAGWDFSFAINNNNEIYATGNNVNGQLGIGGVNFGNVYSFTEISCTNTVYEYNTIETISSAKLRLNGQDRLAERDSIYFNYIQPYQHFEVIPASGINVYSFALKPAEHQPSGTCNFSRIDNINLDITPTTNINSNSLQLSVYALSYNVLRVASGMGGLAFSN